MNEFIKTIKQSDTIYVLIDADNTIMFLETEEWDDLNSNDFGAVLYPIFSDLAHAQLAIDEVFDDCLIDTMTVDNFIWFLAELHETSDYIFFERQGHNREWNEHSAESVYNKLTSSSK